MHLILGRLSASFSFIGQFAEAARLTCRREVPYQDRAYLILPIRCALQLQRGPRTFHRPANLLLMCRGVRTAVLTIFELK
jgi:hypothetical protein